MSATVCYSYDQHLHLLEALTHHISMHFCVLKTSIRERNSAEAMHQMRDLIYKVDAFIDAWRDFLKFPIQNYMLAGVSFLEPISFWMNRVFVLFTSNYFLFDTVVIDCDRLTSIIRQINKLMEIRLLIFSRVVEPDLDISYFLCETLTPGHPLRSDIGEGSIVGDSHYTDLVDSPNLTRLMERTVDLSSPSSIVRAPADTNLDCMSKTDLDIEKWCLKKPKYGVRLAITIFNTRTYIQKACLSKIQSHPISASFYNSSIISSYKTFELSPHYHYARTNGLEDTTSSLDLNYFVKTRIKPIYTTTFRFSDRPFIHVNADEYLALELSHFENLLKMRSEYLTFGETDKLCQKAKIERVSRLMSYDENDRMTALTNGKLTETLTRKLFCSSEETPFILPSDESSISSLNLVFAVQTRFLDFFWLKHAEYNNPDTDLKNKRALHVLLHSVLTTILDIIYIIPGITISEDQDPDFYLNGSIVRFKEAADGFLALPPI